MLKELLLGGGVSLVNIAVHALVMSVVISAARTIGEHKIKHSSAFLVGIMIVTVSILMLAHTAEVAIWGLVYTIFDVSPENSGRFYFAFVNYTTLGYGDVLPASRWRLLGPMTAMNGVLLFGWSTAVIFEVLRRSLNRLSTLEDQPR